MKANRYTKRLDTYQHLIIMLYAQLGQFKRCLSLYDKVIKKSYNISRSNGFKKKIYTLLYKWYHYKYLKLGLLYNLNIGLGSLKGNIVIYHIAQGIVIAGIPAKKIR